MEGGLDETRYRFSTYKMNRQVGARWSWPVRVKNVRSTYVEVPVPISGIREREALIP
jgi:hypothetical protein